MQFQNNRIWDYIGDTFVHRLTKNQQDAIIINFPDVNSNNITSVAGDMNSTNALYQERVDAAIWEYCYVITHQMEQQRIYFQK